MSDSAKIAHVLFYGPAVDNGGFIVLVLSLLVALQQCVRKVDFYAIRSFSRLILASAFDVF